MAKKRKKAFKKITFFFLLLLFAIGTFGYVYIAKKNEKMNLVLLLQKMQEEQRQREEEERIARLKEENYNLCLEKAYEESELTDDLILKKQEVNHLILNNNYNASVYFEDLTLGFTYSYHSSTVYYGASLIKLVDALYLINKAILGEINLDTETITYTEKYLKSFSSGMSKHHYGDRVTLRELITYAISVSDNSAHMMLYDYIGRENLKAYGQSLGAKVIMTGSDAFGNQTAQDTNCYLKEAYRIITENDEYGPFLKEIMDNNERNSFNNDTIKIYHKYGAYDIYYHDIGLNLDEKPYAISILTLHENKNYREVIQNIHEKVRDFQNAFYENRKNTCNLEVYGN